MTNPLLSEESRQRRREANYSDASIAQMLDLATLGLPASDSAKIRNRALEMPVRQIRSYLKALRGRSMKTAIRAHCMECVGWDREGVRECTCPECSLYPYRPFK